MTVGYMEECHMLQDTAVRRSLRQRRWREQKRYIGSRAGGHRSPNRKGRENCLSCRAGSLAIRCRKTKALCDTFFCIAFGVSTSSTETGKGNPVCKSSRTYAGWTPNIRQHMPDKNAMYLYLHNKKELYDVFVEDAGECYAGQSSSASYYYRMWRTHRPNLKPKQGGTFIKCNSRTLFQDTPNDSPGRRTTVDTATIARVNQQQSEHLKVVNLDGEYLELVKRTARRAKADHTPLKYISIQTDGADQTAFSLPVCSPLTHETDKGYTQRQKLLAVLVEGQFVEVFLTLQTVGGGRNVIYTALHRALTRLFEENTKHGENASVEELALQVDNCVEENKIHVLMGCLGSLVGRGVVDRAEVNFMVMGHTHIKIDQFFSRLATACKGHNFSTREEMPVITTTLRGLGNFKETVYPSGRIRRIPGIVRPRSFELRRCEPHDVTIGMKEFMHESMYAGMSAGDIFAGPPHLLFAGGVPIMEPAPAFELKVVDETTIQNMKLRFDATHQRVDVIYLLCSVESL